MALGRLLDADDAPAAGPVRNVGRQSITASVRSHVIRTSRKLKSLSKIVGRTSEFCLANVEGIQRVPNEGDREESVEEVIHHSKLRGWFVAVAEHEDFQLLIILLILANCVTLAMYDPMQPESSTRNSILSNIGTSIPIEAFLKRTASCRSHL